MPDSTQIQAPLLSSVTTSSTPDTAANGRTIACLALLLAVLSFAVFSPGLGFGFVNYDDDAYVYENAHVLGGISAAGLQYAFTTTDIGTWAPLTWISYELDTTVLGARPSSYHLTNVLLHSAAGALLFVALSLMLRSLWPSLTVATIFLLHPLRVESVAWVAERKDVLCAFFWMLGLMAYALYARKPGVGRWLAVFLCCLAGLMSKMMMVTFPFVLLLLDFWPLGRVKPEWESIQKSLWPLVREKLPMVAAATLVMGITAHALSVRAVFHPEGSSHVTGLLRVANNYVFYLEELFWPARLSVLYPLAGVSLWRGLGCGMLLAGSTWFCVRQARKRPWLLVGWLWFLGVLVPVIGFVPAGDVVVADRYTYLPSIGVLLAMMFTVERLAHGWIKTRWMASLVLAALCVLSTRANLPRWHDSLALYNSALDVGPHYTSYNNRGVVLYKSGNVPVALADFDAALSLNPGMVRAYSNRASALSDLGHFDEALGALNRALQLEPAYEEAYLIRGNVYSRTLQPQKALLDYNLYLKLKPTSALGYNNRAAAFLQLKRFADAQADLETCRRLGGQPVAGLVFALAKAAAGQSQ